MEKRMDALSELWREDANVLRVLRAAGVPEACLAGEWSDYDTLAAVCAALPLLRGHPVGERLTARLRNVTDCDLPVCAENAPAFWQSYAAKCGYGAPVLLPDSYAPRHTPPPLPAPEILQEPDGADRLGEWVWRVLTGEIAPPHDGRLLADCTETLERWLKIRLDGQETDDRPDTWVWLDLPHDLPFVRPDPYHAELALRGLAQGDALSDHDRGLLMAQLARTVGQGMARRSASPTTLVLTGGNADAVLALCRYLDSCGGLPATVWLADEPADAEILCGQFAAVRTGIRLTSADTAEDARDKLTAYAAAAPVGRMALNAPDPRVETAVSEAFAKLNGWMS